MNEFKNQRCAILLDSGNGIIYLGILLDGEICPQRTKEIYICEGEIINFAAATDSKDYHIIIGNGHIYKHSNGSLFI